MAQYIDKSAIVAEIERRMDENRGKQTLPQYFGMVEEDLNILSFIDTLEVKEVQEEQVSEEFINALGTMLNDGLPDRYLVSEERIKKSAELLFSIARKQLKNETQEWSEEDKDMLKSIIATCELAEQDRDSSPARHLFEMQANWLKSLKERCTWKPSEEQQINFPQFTFNDVLALQCCMENVKKVQEDKALYDELLLLHNKVYDAYTISKSTNKR